MSASTLLPCELELTECPRCDGDGFTSTDYDDEPDECSMCGGTGDVELCSGCGELPGVVDGFEVCGCNRAAREVAA